MRKIAEPLIIKGEVSSVDIQSAQEFGLAMAAGLCLGIY